MNTKKVLIVVLVLVVLIGGYILLSGQDPVETPNVDENNLQEMNENLNENEVSGELDGEAEVGTTTIEVDAPAE